MQDSSRILSCDWGTSSLRLRLVACEATTRVLATHRSNDGAATLAAVTDNETRGDRFKHTLRAGIRQLQHETGESLDQLPVVISGMASSSIGWQSLPYARLPFSLHGEDVVSARVDLDGRSVLLISGVRDERDVMRGEETELIGLMQLPEARHLKNRCVAILPGTHSKHAEIADGKMVSFRTLISGELFSVLSNHSVLRHSVRSGEQPVVLPREASGPQREAFVEGVCDVLETDLMSALFRTRTRQLLQGQPETLNAAFLSGLLIGSEIGTLERRKSNEDPIVLCAGSAVADWYVAALQTAELDKRVVQIAPEKVDQLSVFGHVALAERFGEEGNST